MGTHSTVKFYNRGRNILNIYNQFDGYVAGEGNEILKFLEDENWKGNGFDDTALLYVCYKKNGKPLHTYATTERDIQEFNYTIDNTEEGLRFTITEDTYNDDNQEVLVTLLRYASFEEFKKFVNTECLRELIFWKHCEEFTDEMRKYFRKADYEQLVKQVEFYNWTDILEEIEKGEF